MEGNDYIAHVNVMSEVTRERASQDALWGEQNHTPEQWLAILVEEVGEVAKEICEWRLQNTGRMGWNYRHELVQVAAVVVAMIESYDRNEGGENG